MNEADLNGADMAAFIDSAAEQNVVQNQANGNELIENDTQANIGSKDCSTDKAVEENRHNQVETTAAGDESNGQFYFFISFHILSDKSFKKTGII